MKSLKGTHLFFVRCKYVPPPILSKTQKHICKHDINQRLVIFFKTGFVVKSSKNLGPIGIVNGAFLGASLLNVQWEIIVATPAPSIGRLLSGGNLEKW